MQDRYHVKTKESKENPKVDLFLEDIFEVFAKHGMSLSHEDIHGSFIVEKDNEKNREWIFSAGVDNV